MHYDTPQPDKNASEVGEVSEAHLPEILQTFQTLNQDPGVEGAAKQLAVGQAQRVECVAKAPAALRTRDRAAEVF